jgi:hypothetical protein
VSLEASQFCDAAHRYDSTKAPRLLTGGC